VMIAVEGAVDAEFYVFQVGHANPLSLGLIVQHCTGLNVLH